MGRPPVPRGASAFRDHFADAHPDVRANAARVLAWPVGKEFTVRDLGWGLGMVLDRAVKAGLVELIAKANGRGGGRRYRRIGEQA